MRAEDGRHHVHVAAHIGEYILDEFECRPVVVFRNERRFHGEVLHTGHRLFGLHLGDVCTSLQEQAQVSFECALTEFLPVAEVPEEEGRGVRRVEGTGDEAVDDFFLVSRNVPDGWFLSVGSRIHGGSKDGH